MEIEVGKMYAVQAMDYEPALAVRVQSKSAIGGWNCINLATDSPIWIAHEELFVHELVLTSGSKGGQFLASPKSTIFELGTVVAHAHLGEDAIDEEVHEALHGYQPTEGMNEPPGQ